MGFPRFTLQLDGEIGVADSVTTVVVLHTAWSISRSLCRIGSQKCNERDPAIMTGFLLGMAGKEAVKCAGSEAEARKMVVPKLLVDAAKVGHNRRLRTLVASDGSDVQRDFTTNAIVEAARLLWALKGPFCSPCWTPRLRR